MARIKSNPVDPDMMAAFAAFMASQAAPAAKSTVKVGEKEVLVSGPAVGTVKSDKGSLHVYIVKTSKMDQALYLSPSPLAVGVHDIAGWWTGTKGPISLDKARLFAAALQFVK